MFQDSVSSILDNMLDSTTLSEEPPVADNVKLQGLIRSAALFTEAELRNLVCYIWFLHHFIELKT